MIGSLLFIAITVISYGGILLIRRMALRRDLVAVPNERSLHDEPIPHGGGLVIFVICIAAYAAISYYVVNTFSWGYFVGACIIAVVSYVDDLRHLSFTIRLCAQAFAAALLIADLDTWHGITMAGGLHLGWWGYLLTFLWIVWMVNAYNFMDGIDGLAGLQGVIAGLGWSALAFLLEMPALYLFGIVTAAASLGFLVNNWPPATIFMGDVGSAFLGYTFAALPLLARHMASGSWDLLPIAAVLFVWFFIFDSLLTRLRRLARGENVLAPHREHLFQRLVFSGLSHRTVTLLYGALSVLLSASVLLSVSYRAEIGLPMFPVVFILTAVLIVICQYRGVLLRRVA